MSLIVPLENLQHTNVENKLRSGSSSSIETEPTTNDSFLTGTTHDIDYTRDSIDVNIFESFLSPWGLVNIFDLGQKSFLSPRGLVNIF